MARPRKNPNKPEWTGMPNSDAAIQEIKNAIAQTHPCFNAIEAEKSNLTDIFSELKRDTHSAIMLITHDMGVVAEVADYVMIMYAGKVCEYNTAEAVFDRPLHPYTQGLLRSIPRRDQNVEELYTIPGNVPTLEEMPAGCRFATRCAYATERCLREAPPQTPSGEGFVFCWKYEE